MIGKREKHVVGNRLGREMTRMVVQWYLNMREKLGRQTQQVRPLKCEKAEKAKKRKKRNILGFLHVDAIKGHQRLG